MSYDLTADKTEKIYQQAAAEIINKDTAQTLFACYQALLRVGLLTCEAEEV